ncbi:hypothetical protein BH09ACT12_BH09ACT12_13060 [soil metagenome]
MLRIPFVGALAAVAVVVALTPIPPADAVTNADLRSAWVPGLCGHSDGYLVDGELPDDGDTTDGRVWLARSTTGALSTGKARWGVAVLSCTAGGVGTSDTIAFYRPDGSFAAAKSLYPITRGGRETATKVAIKKRRAVVRVEGIGRPDEPACCATESAQVVLRWNPIRGRIVVAQKSLYTETPTVHKFLSAVNHNQAAKARRYGTRALVHDYLYLRNLADYRFRLKRCFGALDEAYSDHGDRQCDIRVVGPDYSYDDSLWVNRVTWKRWRAEVPSHD